MPVHISAAEVSNQLPEDVYPAVITKATLELARSGESYNLVLEFEITGPGENTSTDAVGRSFRSWGNLSKKAMWRVYSWLVRLGCIEEGEDITIEEDPFTKEVISPEIVGRRCLLVIRPQPDTRYNEIVDLYGPEGEGRPNTSTSTSNPTRPRRPSLR
jgi:hypothetical protein